MTNISIHIYSAITSALSSLKREEGQDLIEYALLGGLLAVVITAASVFFIVAANNPVMSLFNGMKGCLDFTTGGCFGA